MKLREYSLLARFVHIDLRAGRDGLRADSGAKTISRTLLG